MNVTDWSTRLTKSEVDAELGVKTRKNIVQKSSINVTDWDRFEASEAPVKRGGGGAIGGEEQGGRRKLNGKNTSALYGRPSPFGTDDGRRPISSKSPKKNQIKSLAEMI